jgi:hypothetical protein
MTASPYLDPGLSTPADADSPDDGGVVLQVADVGEFVDQLLVPTYRRRLTATRLWCARWWLHEEAIARLEGVWRAYERMRVEDEWTGVSAWQRDFLDYHLNVLQAADGPFQLCIHGHVDLEPLPNEARPAGLFA